MPETMDMNKQTLKNSFKLIFVILLFLALSGFACEKDCDDIIYRQCCETCRQDALCELNHASLHFFTKEIAFKAFKFDRIDHTLQLFFDIPAKRGKHNPFCLRSNSDIKLALSNPDALFTLYCTFLI